MKDTEKKPSMVDRAREAFKKKSQDTIFTDTNKRREKDAGLAKGGMVRTGPDSARDSKGWEYHNDGKMASDSAAIRREQAREIERETKRTVKGTKALDASTKMGNPARYAKGGMVKRGYGKARCK